MKELIHLATTAEEVVACCGERLDKGFKARARQPENATCKACLRRKDRWRPTRWTVKKKGSKRGPPTRAG